MLKKEKIKVVEAFEKQESSSPKVSTYGATDNLYILMRLHGFLMPERHKFIYMIYAAITIIVCDFYLPFGFTKPILENLSIEISDMSAFFTTLQVAFNGWGGTCKVLFLGLMLNKLHATRGMIEKLDSRCHDPDEIEEQKKVVQLGRKISAVNLFVNLLFSTSTCFGAVMRGRPPFSLYLPYLDWRNSSWEFWVATALEFIIINMACVQQALNDSYPTVYICILRAHVRILKMRITKLGTIITNNDQENIEQLKMCIKDHKIILNIQRILAPVISVTVFIQFSLTAIMMGTTLINVTVFATDFFNRLGSLFYIIAVGFQSFPLCYFAECLQNESADLAVHIFHSNWMDQSFQFRKMIIFFMQRTQCIIEFTAGKLFPITLGSFVRIVKFAYSLYMLIKAMDIEF